MTEHSAPDRQLRPAVRRRPELRPALLGGRGLPAARGLRVLVEDDGGLVVRRPDGSRTVLARAGEVRRALYVSREQARPLRLSGPVPDDLLVLLGAPGPVLAVQLLDWAPPAVVPVQVLRRTSGLEALVAALGLPLEPAGAEELAALDRGALRAVLVRGEPAPPRPGAAWLLPAALLGLLAIPFSGTWPGVVLPALCLLLGGPSVLARLRARREADAAVRAPTAAAGRAVVPSRPAAGLPAGLHAAALQLSAQDVVVADRGRELWLPGPAAGGVTRAELHGTTLHLVDGEGDPLAVLPRAVWCPTPAAAEAFRRDLEGSGLEVRTGLGEGLQAASPTALHSARTPPSLLLGDGERGDADSPYGLVGLYGACAVWAAAVATATSRPAGLPLLAAALGLLALTLHAGVRRRLRDRRALRPGTPS